MKKLLHYIYNYAINNSSKGNSLNIVNNKYKDLLSLYNFITCKRCRQKINQNNIVYSKNYPLNLILINL